MELQGLTSVFPWDESHEDPNQAGLIDLGFDAVPALIEHSDDGRLDSELHGPFEQLPRVSAPRRSCRCRHPEGLGGRRVVPRPPGRRTGRGPCGGAGQRIEHREFLDRQQGYGISKARAEAWFARASKLGEEQYAVQHALPEDKEDTNEQMQILRLLAKKYPARLLDVYRRILGERPEMQSQQLAKLIARGPLIKAQKTDLFHAAAETPSLKQRIIALGELKDLDERDFLGILVKNLEALPKSARTDRFAIAPSPKSRGWWQPLTIHGPGKRRYCRRPGGSQTPCRNA